MKYYCNPINYSYKYQFNKNSQTGQITASREGANPSMILFKCRYYIFPSMTCGFIYSDDLVEWNFHPLKNIPTYDYAPDVRVAGEYVYFCASNHDVGRYYRSKDLFEDNFEEIKGEFPFWDPNLFIDEDGRMYFYWGSSTKQPLYGVELNPDNMTPIGEKMPLIYSKPEENGFERSGEDHIPPRSPEEIAYLLEVFKQTSEGMSESIKEAAMGYIMNAPYIEGVWVNKHNGIYYLQYGTPSSEYNIYSDGVYISENPLGPYKLAKNNPFSYKPGGFIPGAGHGSSMEDESGNLWHVSTMRICINHNFERRIGLWPAGWDQDGDMYCNQRYGDWPINVNKVKENPWADPEWMLLSYDKPTKASSSSENNPPGNVTDENIRTWWKAKSNKPGEWIEIDLENEYDVHGIQVNFADDNLLLALPEGATLTGALHQERWIDEVSQTTRWKLVRIGL